MNTTVEYIQKYVRNNYNLDFKLEMIGTHRFIKYVNGKKNTHLIVIMPKVIQMILILNIGVYMKILWIIKTGVVQVVL